MLNRKANPIWVLKGCMILIIAAFLFSVVNASFAPRAAAQPSPSSADELPSFRNLGGIIPNSKGLPLVNFTSFIKNIARTTGIYSFIFGSGVEELTAPAAGTIRYAVKDGVKINEGDLVFTIEPLGHRVTAKVSGTIRLLAPDGANVEAGQNVVSVSGFPRQDETPANLPITIFGWQELIMVLVGFLVVYLGAAKGFEPLLLVPIGFGIIFVNIPGAGMGAAQVVAADGTVTHTAGFLNVIYEAGVGNEFFPLIIFIGIGAMTDFGPLIANPKTALLGAAAQFGVFGTLFGISLANYLPSVAFNLKEACSVAIIGGADGPTTIYIAAKLAPHLLATVAVAAYSYMALVPLIQPPIMRALTSKKERLIRMRQLRPVSKIEKIAFPMVVFVLSILLIPSAAPLIGCLMFGNFIREIGVVDRLSNTAQNDLMNIVSLFLSLGVGSQMTPQKFLNPSSLIIVVMGLLAFSIATATGVLVAKFMNLFLKEKINPLIGSAGVSAVPMAARVSNKVGLEEDPSNFVLMHAMGPNVAGVIGTAIAAGVMIAVYGG